MQIGELFIQLGVKGDTKELDKTIKQMDEAQKKNKELLKYRQALAKAETQSEKALIKKNFADKIQLENLKKQSASIKQQNANWVGLAKGVLVFIGAAALAYKAMDRLIASFASANQQMITFQRTTGLSFQSLNKYASANAAVNFNSSIEGTAQTMSRLASNLYDIRMGRGDISPYQELAFVGGKAFNPMGMSVEQLIESVREAIKGVDDVQATNIIQRMGFAPDDLLMLRMGREEFEKINDLFLSREQREEMNRYALELKQIKLGFEKTWQEILINVAPAFNDLSKVILNLFKIFERLNKLVITLFMKPVILGFKIIGSVISNVTNGVKALTKAFIETFNVLKPIFSILKMIGEIIWLPLEDVLTYLSGGDSLTGRALDGMNNVIDNIGNKFKLPDWASKFLPPTNTNQLSQNTNNINTNNQFTINSNQPTEKIAQGLINTFTPSQVQFSTVAV